MALIISQKGKRTQKIDKSDFEKEGNLQSYIHENPESIPVYEIEESKRLFVVAREFKTESGPIDALAIDKDGDIYVVETKLYKNPDKRTVVAQALDYGASLWRHSDYSEFIKLINEEINKRFKISFEEKVRNFFDIDEEQTGALLEAIRTNLQQGNIKFVILMDDVSDRLKDLIVYINQNSQFDIYAVQMEYYKFESYEIMIPKLFGVEVKKSMTSNSAGSPRRKWDEQGFFEEVKKVFSKSDFELILKFYTFSKESADEIHWGTGVNQSSFSAGFNKLGNRPLFVLLSDGRMKISTEYPKRGATKEQISNLDHLNLELKKIGLEVNPKSERTVFTLPEWSSKLDVMIKTIKKSID
ncbi:MAG: hypothetical protein A2735_00275 [Candidatus Yanofskybacteria bacterium RIFCSPHIGHO2_01_FULL_41_21]|uniref:DUF91 domain-containing protein n=1 Tax=Candidatus Yanofskybacteria bacterium RIFCSPHIGHO2_01_FULL_41_21 TaxID=1802660 RepID=A0A1F8EBL6_9BACT|nr:MAG: hypothetical protein A2735_00275 [Candidatus Yanofskybacteria bacterium RIFCSPHIGHO2_01_FULL_41_21]